MVLIHEYLPKTANQLAFIHDELQFEANKEDLEDLKFLLKCTAMQAGEYYNMRCPTAAEANSGMNWAETH